MKKLTKDVKKVIKRLDFEMAEFSVTKDASGECIIQGYANTSSKDRVGDVVDPSAFEASLPTYMKNPQLLENHNWEKVAGRTMEAKITDKGLWIKARISDTRSDLKTLIREKCLSTFSIGYNELDADYDESTKTKLVKQLELLEISIVTIPANHEAMFTVMDEKTPDSDTAAAGEKSALVNNLRKFVGDVESALSRKMSGNEVGAVCGYFIEHKGNEMKTQDLIKLLTEKSAAPAPAPVKAEAPAAAAEGKPEAGGDDALAAIMSKLDALAQAIVGVSQRLDKMSKEEAGEAEPKAEEKPEDKPAEEKPAKEDEKAEDKKPSDEEEMSEEDCAKELADLDAAIAQAESELEND